MTELGGISLPLTESRLQFFCHKMVKKGRKVFGPKLPVFSEFILSGIGGLTTIVITIGPYDVICGAARMIG